MNNELEMKLNAISNHISIYDYELKLSDNEIEEIDYYNDNDYYDNDND